MRIRRASAGEVRPWSLAVLMGKIPAVGLVACLCATIVAGAAYIGKTFEDRVRALEMWKSEQNGHLKEIQRDIEWIKKHLDNAEPKR